MNEPKISKEMAEQEFDRFLDAMDIDSDSGAMDEEDRKGFDQQKARVVSAIMRGNLIVDDEGQPVYTPQTGDGEAITFFEPTGASLMAMDRKKKGEDIGKLYAIAADITKQPASKFARMKNRDVRVCTAIVTLFLG